MALRTIGALWRKKNKNGTFFTGIIDAGVFGKITIAVFENKKKEGGDKKPDARICIFEQDEGS